MDNPKYQKILEALQPLLSGLFEKNIIKLGFYIDFDNPCLMILNDQDQVEDYFKLDPETYILLQEWL